MNPIAEEILMHYGMPRRSGRYPWGSGENPYQHSGDFLSRIDELKSQGMSDTEIAKAMGLTTTQYRTQKSLAKDERRALDVARAKSLREDGLSLNEIAKEMGFANDSSVRSLLNENSEVRMNQAKTTAEFIKKQIDEKGMIDVGAGVERELGISKEKLNEALYMLEMEGYPVYGGRVDQITNPGKKTTLRVICPPGTEHKEIYDFENINSLKDYVSHDDGETFDPKFVYPKSMDSKRLQIRYSEDGGELKDGVVEIRRGVDDLSLGESHYAQVRILVDGSHYIKGMMVKESTGMMVNVGIGRAWFNHTWTLNDALLPLTVPQSEVILNRIDAVILEVDSRESVRANTIKIVKGTPATNPVKPSMIKTNDRWQYPLAYIRVNSGVTSIRQENITNAVGTSECPFVTAPLEKMSIDALVAQWKDQWDAFYEKETSDMEATNSFWKDQWSKWFNAQTEEIQQSYLDWEKQWNDWYATQTADMQETNSYWKQLWATWFNEYTNNNTSEMAAWRENAQALFDEWFQQLKDTLSENVEANLANQILELQERTKILEEIVEGIRTEFTVYNKLYDNGYENHDKLLDSSDGTIIDSDIEPIVARAYSSSLILDSNGQPIDGRVIFCIR